MSILYIARPSIIDLPPGEDPNALAWFAQFGSGHLRHADQALTAWSDRNGVEYVTAPMSWGEYLRLLDEAHWYEA